MQATAFNSVRIPIIIATPQLDTLKTHHGVLAVHGVHVAQLADVLTMDAYAGSKVILVEDGHFFNDIVPTVRQMLRDNKSVFVYALDADAMQRPFPSRVMDLTVDAIEVRKHNALCTYCGEAAPYTVSTERLPDSQVLLGGHEVYSAVCLRHLKQSHIMR